MNTLATVLDLNKPSTYREYFIGIDEFNHPKVYTDQHATFVLLIRLILLEPGTYPNHPDMGVGLVSRYRFAMKEKLANLQTRIEEQISTYLPEFSAVNVEVSYEKEHKYTQISITIDEITYKMTYNPETNVLSSVA